MTRQFISGTKSESYHDWLMVTPTKACTGRLTLASLVSLMYKPDEWAVLTSKGLLLNVPICSANRETKIKFIIFSRSHLLAFWIHEKARSKVEKARFMDLAFSLFGSRLLAFSFLWISRSRLLTFLDLAFSRSRFYGSRVLVFSLLDISRSRDLAFGNLVFLCSRLWKSRVLAFSP